MSNDLSNANRIMLKRDLPPEVMAILPTPYAFAARWLRFVPLDMIARFDWKSLLAARWQDERDARGLPTFTPDKRDARGFPTFTHDENYDLNGKTVALELPNYNEKNSERFRVPLVLALETRTYIDSSTRSLPFIEVLERHPFAISLDTPFSAHQFMSEVEKAFRTANLQPQRELAS